MANFEAVRWNFSLSTNPEIGRSELCHPSLKSYQIRFFDPSGDILAEVQLGLNKTFKPMVPTSDMENPYTKVSCLFIKHLLTSGFITVDGTEKLC